MEVAVAGGVRALVMLARFCNHEGVQEQVSTNCDLETQFCIYLVSSYRTQMRSCELHFVFVRMVVTDRILIAVLQTECSGRSWNSSRKILWLYFGRTSSIAEVNDVVSASEFDF